MYRPFYHTLLLVLSRGVLWLLVLAAAATLLTLGVPNLAGAVPGRNSPAGGNFAVSITPVATPLYGTALVRNSGALFSP